MIRLVEIFAFLGLATMAHLVILGGPPDGTSAAGGEEGEAMVSLAPADAALARMVADWDAPPEALTSVAQTLVTPLATPSRPPQPKAAAARAIAPAGLALPAAASADDAPVADTAPPADHAPVSSLRPIARKPVPEKNAEIAKRAPKKQTATQATAAQRAAGKGKVRAAGQQPKGAAPSVSKSEINSAMRSWQSQIRTRVERNKRYPHGTRDAGGVVVRLTVARSGALQSVQILKSSGSAELDQAAIAAVRRAKRFAAAPQLVQGASFGFDLPMSFRK